MEKMRIKRLLTICLALMLSVSMLPAGTFADTEAAAGEQKQTTAEQPRQEDTGADNETQPPAEDFGSSENKSDESSEVADEESVQPEKSSDDENVKDENSQPLQKNPVVNEKNNSDVAVTDSNNGLEKKVLKKDVPEVVVKSARDDYIFNTSWKEGGNNSVVSDDGSTITITPQSNSRHTATLQVFFSFHGTESFAKESIRIEIPKNIFTNWDGDDYPVFSNTWGHTVQYAVANTVEKSKATDEMDGPFCYYIDGDNIVLENFKAITNADANIEISFSFDDKKVGENVDENNDGVMDYFKTTFDTKLYYNDELEQEKSSTAIVDTDIYEGTYTKSTLGLGQDGVYTKWQPSWGTEPPRQGNKYFYYLWQVKVVNSPNNSQPYSISLNDTPQVSTAGDAEVLGIKYIGNKDNLGDSDVAGIAGKDDSTVDVIKVGPASAGYFRPGADDGPRLGIWAILVRYKVDILEERVNEEGQKELAADLLNTAEITTLSKSGKKIVVTKTAEGPVRIAIGDGVPAPPSVSVTKARHYQHGDNYVETFLLNGLSVNLNPDSYIGNGRLADWTIDSMGMPNIATWNEETETYTSDPYTIEIKDTQMYFHTNKSATGPSCNNYFSDLENVTELGEGDYEFTYFSVKFDEFDAVYSELSKNWEIDKVARTDYEKYGRVYIYLNDSTTPCGYVVRHESGRFDFISQDSRIQSKTDIHTGGNSYQPAATTFVTLPEGVYHISAKYDNSNSDQPAFYATMQLALNERVLPSDTIKDHLRADIEDRGRFGSVITNRATVDLKNDAGSLLAHDDSFNYGTITSKSFFLTTPINTTSLTKEVLLGGGDYPEEKVQRKSILVRAINRIDCPTEHASDTYLHDYLMTTGTFYDLLPAGTYAENVRISNFDASEYTVSFEQDYQGSGQTMMKVEYEISPDKANWKDGDTSQVINLHYTLVNPYDNIDDRGTNTVDNVAFVNTDAIINPGSSYKIDNIQSDKQEFFEGLSNDNQGKILFNRCNETWDPITSRQGTLKKTVGTTEVPAYKDNNKEFFGQTYNYKYVYTTVSSQTTDIVFYDILESGAENQESEWRGKLNRVDVSSLQAKVGIDGNKCDPVIYYSTSDFESYEPTENEKDLADSRRWTTNAPSDLSTVKAIAVDCRKTVEGTDYEFNGSGALAFYVYMDAPSAPNNTLWDSNKKAVNTLCMYSRLSGSQENVLLTDYATVQIEATKVDVEKIWDDDENRDNIRPESVTVKLLADGDEVDSAELNDGNDWKHSFLNLKKYDYSNGEEREIEYTIEEEKTDVITDEDGSGTYESVIETDEEDPTKVTVTNTHTPETTKVIVKKKWEGQEDEDLIPESIDVDLLADGEKLYTATLTEENEWSYTFGESEDEVLYVNNGSGPIRYTVSEPTVPDGYTLGEPEIETDAETGISTFTLTNRYSAEGTLKLGGLKKLDVETGKLVAGQFTFTLTDNGTQVATGTNDKDGNITFTPAEITYSYNTAEEEDDRGKHTLVITETGADGNGATADAAPVTVEVTVTDDGKGTLEVSPADITESVEMTNSYEATGDITFSGKKSIAHGRRIEEGEVFTFTVKEGDKTVATGTSDADGNIEFTKIEYTLNKDKDDTGLHTYTVTEDKYEKKNGVTNSEQSYTVTVDVKDKGNGELEVTPSEEFSGLDFENPYEAEGEISADLTKVLENRAFKDGDEWTFSIEAEDGAPLPVDEEGNEVSEVTLKPTEGNEAEISLGTFKYDLSDLGDKAYESKTFTYTITESGEVAGVKNDSDTDRKLKIKVTDDGSGELKVELADDSEELKFTNTYETAGEITFSGRKTLNGETLKAGQFSFELYDKDGKKLDTVTNKADGSYSFKTLKYTGDDLDKDADGNYVDTTKTYKVVEKKGNDPHITYDSKEYNITVTLKDDGQGSINVTADPDEGSLDFTNTYTERRADCTILIKKVNTKGKAISGAVFEIWKVSAESEEQLTADECEWLDDDDQFEVGTDPFEITGLEDGRYQIREVEAPEGYKIYDKKPIAFTITDGVLDPDRNVLSANVKYKKTPGKNKHTFTVTNEGKGDKVKTGDDSHAGLYLGLMLLCGAMLAGIAVYRKRREDR